MTVDRCTEYAADPNGVFRPAIPAAAIPGRYGEARVAAPMRRQRQCGGQADSFRAKQYGGDYMHSNDVIDTSAGVVYRNYTLLHRKSASVHLPRQRALCI
jgi:hypothetical protein